MQHTVSFATHNLVGHNGNPRPHLVVHSSRLMHHAPAPCTTVSFATHAPYTMHHDHGVVRHPRFGQSQWQPSTTFNRAQQQTYAPCTTMSFATHAPCTMHHTPCTMHHGVVRHPCTMHHGVVRLPRFGWSPQTQTHTTHTHTPPPPPHTLAVLPASCLHQLTRGSYNNTQV